MTRPRLEAFRVRPVAPELVQCKPGRAWMEAFANRHAYRCLPLTIANTHGWELLVPGAFEVEWNGGPAIADLAVRQLELFPDDLPFADFAMSNFARGIVTFHTGYLFRTPPGWNILTTGPFNESRQDISPLTGIIESDWLPYPFTMNWRMSRPGTVRFARGDVFCTVMPVPKNYLDQWDVAIHDLNDDPVLQAELDVFRLSRTEFREGLPTNDRQTLKDGWQRHYFVGRFPDGTEVVDHVNRLRLNAPVDRSGTRPLLAKAASASPAATHLLATDPHRHWRPDSLLNQLDHQQTEVNRSGQTRLRDGVLTPAPGTAVLTRDTKLDPAVFGFVFQPNFLTPGECALLAEAAAEVAAGETVPDAADPFAGGRVVAFGDILAARSGAAALIRDVQRRVTERLWNFYQLKTPVFVATARLARWRSGMHMPTRASMASAEESPLGMPFRDFASIVWLNDEYEGGEVYFPRLDLIVRPAAGMLLGFTGGWYHDQGVSRVLSGARLTMQAFYTFDPSHRDKAVYGPSAPAE
jgi:Family of unknown function (DUF6065)